MILTDDDVRWDTEEKENDKDGGCAPLTCRFGRGQNDDDDDNEDGAV